MATPNRDDSEKHSVERLRLLFRDIVHVSRRLARRKLGHTNLTMSEMLTLAVLEHQDVIAAGDIARRLEVAKATMSRILGRLEKERYVTRVRDPADARRILVAITPRGRRLRERVGPFWVEMGKGMFRGFDDSERETLEASLERIYENVLRFQREMERAR